MYVFRNKHTQTPTLPTMQKRIVKQALLTQQLLEHTVPNIVMFDSYH